ncbi:hypothetical protein KSP39_PZI006432 [Platanthera zijinensis]|uniref:Jacalin-type lectin domain-containing protein n=1 Tax=Platanthera zijinensis TaxID=2320716 RepID=A0AAP0G9L6_9ASPA
MSEVISSLTFLTNQTEYGPYGSKEGTFFSFKTSNGEITGFHGTSGIYLNSIGCYVKPPGSSMPAVKEKKVKDSIFLLDMFLLSFHAFYSLLMFFFHRVCSSRNITLSAISSS